MFEGMKEESVDEFNMGDEVYCDTCGKDYTASDEEGGITFGSKAVCPDCAPRVEAGAIENDEEEWIKFRCPEGKSFADWVRQDLRQGESGIIKVVTYKD